MAKGADELVDEIQARVGRTENQVVITDARCTDWLNEGQRAIVDSVAGLHELTFKNTTSIDSTQQLRYPIAEISVGDVSAAAMDSSNANIPNRVWNVDLLDGRNTTRLKFVHLDEWDKHQPDPTSSDIPFSRPRIWTRRSDNIEITPLSSCSFVDLDLRFDGDFWPIDFTVGSSCKSELRRSDEGLTLYGVAKAWGAIGGPNGEAKSELWMKRFTNPNPTESDRQGWLEDYKDRNDTLWEWDGDMFSDADTFLDHATP